MVSYKDRQGGCQREGKHPDADGIRWWCGLHMPDRKPRVQADDADIATDGRVAELTQALREAQQTLMEIANIRDIGWPPNTPVDKYKIMMTHMADRAKEAHAALHEKGLLG